ncbi:MAG: SDR family NAD(P)-dependent oxidoreductase [Gammaproteobacteria bacterium]|nr:MAG: SDR family NAD(P)-dependent oxidoreductase [Gammaproteobacteria bacterium]
MNIDPTLITVAGKRTGYHLAKSFLQRGMPVIGTFRTRYDSLDELEQLGADLYRCDFHRREDVEQLILRILERYPRLRGIVHDVSEWLSDDNDMPLHRVMARMMRVHVGVPYEINHSLAPLLLACTDESADIIHISDYIGSRGSQKHIVSTAGKGDGAFALPGIEPTPLNSEQRAYLVVHDEEQQSCLKSAA